VRDLERSLRFYRDVLGLKPFGLEEFHRKERRIVSLRVTPTFIFHLRPDATTGDMRAAPAFALFIFVGAKPHIDWAADAVVR